MLQIKNLVRASVALVALGTAIGCGSSKVYPVKGKVTFEGKSMKGGGTISFVPLGNQAGKTAGGEIKEDGTYELTTNKPGDGSMEGEFRVVITQVTEQEPERSRDGEKAARKGRSLPEADRIPEVYSDAYKSPLTAKVEAKSNEIDFDLKRDAVPAKAALRGDPARDTFAELNSFRFLPRPD